MNRIILDVPKVKQLPRYCGPASLSMVLSYWGYEINQEKIAESLNPTKRGYCLGDIQDLAEYWGFNTDWEDDTSLEPLIDNVICGYPIITRVRCAPLYEHPHFTVIKGYDLDKEEIYFNDPNNLNNTSLSFEKFFEKWKITGGGEKTRLWMTVWPNE